MFFFRERRRTARSDFANSLAVDHNVLIVACDPAFRHFKADQLALHAGFFLLCQRVASNEVAFIQFADPAEVCFEQRGCLRRSRGRKEPCPLRAAKCCARRSRREELRHLNRSFRRRESCSRAVRLIGGGVDFESIFARVTGARNNRRQRRQPGLS